MLKGYKDSVSYSRLSLYQSCAEKYRLKYLAKEEGKEYSSRYVTLEEPLIKGSLAHSMIEAYLQGMTKDDAISTQLTLWLSDLCFIEPIDGDPVGAEGVNINHLEFYAKECGMLVARCSEGYYKEDKIRNKDGSVPKDPLGKYPPGGFLKDYRDAKLDQYKRYVDDQAARANNSFKRMSLANIAASAASFCYLFELPEEVASVEGIELDLSKNPIGFSNNQYYWNGYIDTEYKSKAGATIINDHKSEKEKRRPEDVAFDLQLNSYASVRYEQTGSMPEFIAITHLKTNSVIASATSPYIVNLCMDYLEQIQEEIEIITEAKGVDKPWMKKWPGKFGSPCMRRHWETKAVESVCPYFIKCHPEYYQCIKDEVDDYFGVIGD